MRPRLHHLLVLVTLAALLELLVFHTLAPAPDAPTPVTPAARAVEPHLGDPSAAELAAAPGPVYRLETEDGMAAWVYLTADGEGVERVELRFVIMGTAEYVDGRWVRKDTNPVSHPTPLELGKLVVQRGPDRKVSGLAASWHERGHWHQPGARGQLDCTLVSTPGGAPYGTLRIDEVQQVWPAHAECGQDYRIVHTPRPAQPVTRVSRLR